jgi:cytochrome b561
MHWAIAIAIIGAVALGSIQESADQAFLTSAVRLGQ